MNHGGTMAQTTVQTLAAYLDDEITSMPNLTTAASLVTVSALASGNITSGFGNIDNGTSNITTGGLLKIDIDSGVTPANDATGINAAGSITLGVGNDAGLYVQSDNLYIENKTQDKVHEETFYFNAIKGSFEGIKESPKNIVETKKTKKKNDKPKVEKKQTASKNRYTIQVASWIDFLQEDVLPEKRENKGLEGVLKNTFPEWRR